MQRLIRDYYQQLHENKMEIFISSMKEMDRFLEKYNLPKLNQEEMENVRTSTEIKTVIRNLPTNNIPGSDGFIGEFHQKFRKELTPILIKVFQEIAEEGKLPGSFYEATITLIPKPAKMSQKKKRKIQANIIDEHRCKTPQQNSSKQNSTIY